MKRRYFISFLLTLFVLLLTNRHFYVLKPTDVSFDAIGTSKDFVFFTAQVDKKDGTFQNKKEAYKEIKLQRDDTKNVFMEIKRAGKIKAFRLFVENVEPRTDFYISNIKFKGKPVSDLSSFKSNEADISVKNGTLKIHPKGSIININYNGNIDNLQSEQGFEPFAFIIIFILSYLTFIKLTSYLADFKYIENQSKSDVIFLGIFFVLLFIPLSYISDDNILKTEKRKAAEFKPLITNHGEINYDFGKNFDKWFNDRFNCREKLIELSQNLSVVNKYWETESVLKGKKDWLFYKAENSVINFQNNDAFTKEELKNVAEYLTSIDDYCKKHNKKFYFLITPAKNRIYGEFFPEKIKKFNPDSKSRAVLLRDYLKRKTKIKAIMPNSNIVKNKKNKQLYYKTDTHWNGLGAYYAYEVVFNEIKKDFKDLKKTKINKMEIAVMNTGDLNSMVPDRLKVKEKYQMKFLIQNRSYQCKSLKNGALQECQNEFGKYNVVVYRDSFMAALIPYFAQNFKTSNFIWKFQVKQNDIENADIVLLEVTERLLGELKDCVPISGVK